MFDIFLPYLIGLALGISPSDSGGAVSSSSGTTDVEMREPEDQTATGQFTTAGEIKMILTATKPNWVAVRNYEGQDLLYFTNLLAWRCGLWGISYGINDEAPETELPLEPCHEGTNAPNAMTDIENYLPYVALRENSVETVTVQLMYDDGTSETAEYDRAAIQMP